MSQSLLKNIFAKGTLNIFNVLVPLLVIPYVYRILGPDTVGKVEYGSTIYTYFGMLGMFGIYNYGLREISRNRNDKEKVKNIYKHLFIIGFAFNLFFFVIYEFFVAYFIKDTSQKQLMYVLGLNLIAQVFYIEWINEAYEDFKFITVKTIIIRLLNVGSIFLLIKVPSDFLPYVFILVISLFVNNVVSFIRSQRYVRVQMSDLFNELKIKPYLVPLLLILILNNTNILYTMLDRTMLGSFLGVKEVAYYSVGQKITETAKILLLSITFVSLPRLSLYLENDKELYVKWIQKLMRIMLLIVLPTALGLFMLSKEVVLLFAGSQYIAAIPSLKIFALRMILLAIESILYNQIMFLHRKEKVLLSIALFCGVLNVLIKFIILDYLNSYSAILTTFFAEMLFEVICLIYIKKRLKISTGLFDKQNLHYVFLSLLFIPIISLSHCIFTNQYLFMVSSILFCFTFYFLGLGFLKDSVYLEIRKRIS